MVVFIEQDELCARHSWMVGPGKYTEYLVRPFRLSGTLRWLERVSTALVLEGPSGFGRDVNVAPHRVAQHSTIAIAVRIASRTAVPTKVTAYLAH